MIDLLVALLVVVGAAFAAIAGLGILRLPDVMIRMHASTKAGTLGVGLILIAAALALPDSGVAFRAISIILFLLLTAPIGAHLIARAAYRTGTPLWSRTVLDELRAARGGARSPGTPRDGQSALSGGSSGRSGSGRDGEAV